MIKKIGIIMNGVTGRMGTNQHLIRSILAIREQGGVPCGDFTIMPDPILTGRNLEKVKARRKARSRTLHRRSRCSSCRLLQ